MKLKPKALEEKESICRKALHAIAKEKCLTETIVLHGGGAMHFIYSSPRYSSDLDFSLKNKAVSMTAVVDNILDVLAKHFQTKYSNCKNRNSSMIRAVERIKINEKGGNLVVNVEIGNDPVFDAITTGGEFHPLQVESVSELYVDKIIASLGRMKTRGTIKGTDLFDLFFIKSILKKPMVAELLIKKAGSYDFFGWDRETVLNVISYILSKDKKPKIVQDIKSTVMPDVAGLFPFDDVFFREVSHVFADVIELIK